MDDSEESELVFVVPSSVENSGTGETLEDPLGLSSEAKSSVAADSSSFACFQLSGVTQEHDSESLRIDEPQDSIIPSSPDVLHIHLSTTPSLKYGSGDAKSIPKSNDGMNLNDDKDCGRMSPDMMVSGDSPYREDMMEDKNVKPTFSHDGDANFTDHDSGKIKSTKVGMENLPGSHLSNDKSSLNNSNGSDPYNAETQPYSESEPTAECTNESSYSMSRYLPQSTDKNSSSAPLFVTASSTGDSEKPSTTLSDPVPVPIIPEIGEDHLVNNTEGDDGTSQIDEQNDLHCDEGTDLRSQESSQDDLNLYLTLESQVSLAMSLPTGEQAEIVPPSGEENANCKDQCQNEKKNGKTENLNCTSNDSDQATSHKKENRDPQSSNIPQISESASPINENESGFSMECSRATTFASEDNSEIPNSKIQSDITMDSNDAEQSERKSSSSEPMTQPEEKNSTAKQPCSSDFSDNCQVPAAEEKRSALSSVENVNTVQAEVARPLIMYGENSNSNDANYSAMEKPAENIDKVTKEILLLSQSVNVNATNRDETSEINPSMQSTFVNEPASSLIEDVPPLFPSPSTWTDSGSTSKGISDSPYMDSSDFSMEYSLLDKERIGDLETQPFTASAPSKSGLKMTQDDQCLSTTIATSPQSSGNGHSKGDVTEIVKDIVGSIVDSIIEKKGKGHNNCKNHNTSSNFANPNLPKQKDKQPPSAKSTHCGKPMESEDLFEVRQNIEQDKSSDTIAVDETSDHELDKESTPKDEGGYVYRVTRSETIETLFNGEVIDKKVLPRKIKYLKKYPAKSFAQTSGGSGYLADTSSLSRSSSNCSAKTNLTDSPAFGIPETSLPLAVRRNELAITSSSDSSQNLNSQQHSLTHAHDKSKELSPLSSPRCSDVGIPPKKRSSPMVVLTPLSTQQLAAHHTHDSPDQGNIATPPSNINPPISGSTPVDFQSKSDTSSDVTNSNSPEFGYVGETMAATSVPLVDCCEPSTSAAHKICKASEDTMSDGIPVLARPAMEGYFYPGTMHHQDQISGKCTVIFHADKMMSEIRESDVLLIDKLDVGQEVQVLDKDSDFYVPGTILSLCQINNESGYLVEVASSSDTTPSGTKKFSKKDVAIKRTSLTWEQKRSFVQPINNVPSSSDVSLDNVVDGKRKSRRSTRSCGIVKTMSSPIVTKVQRSLRKRRLETATSVQGGKTKRTKLVYKKSTDSGSKAIFWNMCFLLTQRSQQCVLFESDSDGSNPDIGYSKEDVAIKIKAGGGHIAKDFTDLTIMKCEETFVISDAYCRTMNYLKALATGTECVSYRWIIDSMDKAQLLSKSNYVLPAGYSLQQVKVVERLKTPNFPLHGLKVCLRLKDHSSWRPLLSLAGCDVVTYRKSGANDLSRECFDVIVADSSTFLAVLETNDFPATSIVSVEWIVQCLINSKKLSFDAHEQYGFQHSAC